MTIRKYGFEKESGDKPSTVSYRTYFLRLVPQLRPQILTALSTTALPPFAEVLTNSQSDIDSLSSLRLSELPESYLIPRQPENIREHVIKRMFPNWQALQNTKSATSLRQALQDWARKHNLTDDWCLNHALATLRGCDPEKSESKMQRAWQNSTYVGSALAIQFSVGREFEEAGIYTFQFKHGEIEFEVSAPVYSSTSSFNEDIEKEFKEFISHNGQSIKGARGALRQQKTAYLKKVREFAKERGLKEPQNYRRAENHLKWLIEYQIPQRLTVPQICEKYRLPIKTVDSGIRTARKLVELSNPAESLKGRIG